jgi:hypothetical protein
MLSTTAGSRDANLERGAHERAAAPLNAGGVARQSPARIVNDRRSAPCIEAIGCKRSTVARHEVGCEHVAEALLKCFIHVGIERQEPHTHGLTLSSPDSFDPDRFKGLPTE